MSESIEHKNTFYFKDRLKQAYVSLDGITVSLNVERRHQSSIIVVHLSLDVGHGISRGLPNGSRDADT